MRSDPPPSSVRANSPHHDSSSHAMRAFGDCPRFCCSLPRLLAPAYGARRARDRSSRKRHRSKRMPTKQVALVQLARGSDRPASSSRCSTRGRRTPSTFTRPNAASARRSPSCSPARRTPRTSRPPCASITASRSRTPPARRCASSPRISTPPSTTPRLRRAMKAVLDLARPRRSRSGEAHPGDQHVRPGQDAENSPPCSPLQKTETDAKVQRALREAIALIQLKDEDPQVQIAAAQGTRRARLDPQPATSSSALAKEPKRADKADVVKAAHRRAGRHRRPHPRR